MVSKNDVIQVIDKSHSWHGCFVQVTGTTDTSTYGVMRVPRKPQSKVKLDHNQYEVIGHVTDELKGV